MALPPKKVYIQEAAPQILTNLSSRHSADILRLEIVYFYYLIFKEQVNRFKVLKLTLSSQHWGQTL